MTPKRKPPVRSGRPSGGGAIRYRETEEQYVPLAKLEGAHQSELGGICDRCERRFHKGDWVFVEDDRQVGVNCCATEADSRPVGDPKPLGYVDFGIDAADLDDIEGRDFVPISQVMPVGRGKADMCPRCFQIPASNGICGC